MIIIKKQNFSELAIFNKIPTFKEKLHVGRPNIGNKKHLFERIDQLLDKRWLTNNGTYVQELEQRIADFLKVKHCILMCNGTIALEIVIRASELTGEVILPSFTFIATAHALQWQEITPVFCDINPQTHTLDPLRIEAMITPRTTGIIGVHIWGQPCNIQALTVIANKHNLKLLFDASHAFGCSANNKMIGNFGDAEVFSFHATKFINTFEGGAVVTNNDELARKIRLMKNFGFAGLDNVIYIGTNGKMNEVCAAMGLTSLESFEEFVSINYYNYRHYQNELADIPGISLFIYDESEKCNYQYIVVEVDESKTKVSRDELIQILHAENVIARRYFYPGCHRMQPYAAYFPHSWLMLPETEKLVKRVLILPTGTSVDQPEISQICNIIRLAISKGETVREKLKQQLAISRK